MSRLTLRLPQSLHMQLSSLAKSEGVSLNQYIVYALTQQTSIKYQVVPISKDEVEQQATRFQSVVESLGEPDPKAVEDFWANREPVQAEGGLSTELIEKIEQRIQARKPQPKPEVS